MAKVKDGVRTPLLARGQDSWELLLDTGEALLAEAGWEGFTLAAIRRRAGLSTGSIYWRVESKEALFAAIHERWNERIAAESAAFYDDTMWEGVAIEVAIDRLVHLVADTFQGHSALLRALILRAGSDQAAAERGSASVKSHAESFVRIVSPRLAAAGHAQPEMAAQFGQRMVFSSLIARVTWPEQELEPALPWDQFVGELGLAAQAYMLKGLR